VLGVIASVIGVLMAWWTLAALVTILPIEFPPHSSPTLSLPVVMMAAVIAVLIVIAVTIWPSWSLTRASLNEILSGAWQQTRRPWPRSFGRGVIAVEVALATVLLTSGGLLIRSLDRLLAVDLGFKPESILTMEVTPLDQSPAVWSRYFREVLTALRNVPGVAAAGAIDGMPLANTGMVVMATDPANPGPLDEATNAGVTPGYLEALGVRVLAGRTFTEDDHGINNIVIDDVLAKRFFQGREAVGQTVKSVAGPQMIIGVVSAIRDSPQSNDPTFYSMLTPHVFLPPTLVIRANKGARLPHDALRTAAQSVGTRVLVERIRPGSDLLDDRLSIPRHRVALLGLLAGLGLLLTLVGTAGVTAYAVARRTQEVGVRLAFGATPKQVVRGITFEALRPIALGLIIGLAAATYTTAFINAFLFQIQEYDPLTVSAVIIALSAATLTAAWLPARRAARVDPVQALRTE
jgi:predicted permease